MVATFLTTWLENAAPSLRGESVRKYTQVINLHLIPGLGGHRLTALTPDHVQRFYTAKLRETNSKTGRPLTPASVRVMHFVLHRALDQAVRWGKVTRNVTDLVDLPRLPRVEARSLDADGARWAINAAASERLEALFVLALTAGLRRGELLGLRWSAVDLDKGAVNVLGTLTPTNVVAEPKSWSSKRRVPIGAVAVAALRRWKALQAAERLQATTWDDQGYVFTTATGKPLAPMVVTRGWNRVLVRAGLPTMPFHSTRHTAASLMVEAGVSPKVAAERLGHATAGITLDRYSHLTDALRHEAALAIDRLLGGA